MKRWTIEYDNDTGPEDLGLIEWWWLLKDGNRVGKLCVDDALADEICKALNSREP